MTIDLSSYLDGLIPGAWDEEGALVGGLAVVRGKGVIHRSAGVTLAPGDALNHVVMFS